MGLSDFERDVLAALARIEPDPLCPKCGQRSQDPRSQNGWCVKCDAARERILEAKRRWWRNNRGAEARRAS